MVKVRSQALSILNRRRSKRSELIEALKKHFEEEKH
jgi:SOS response regulatory protein OraA/RecX